MTYPLSGYSAGPLFWHFAENPIAIIGACLPTLAPLWRGNDRSTSKQWPRFNGPSKNSDSGKYDNLEVQHQKVKISHDTSLRHLVTRGPAIDISTGDIPLDDRPESGINVEATFVTSYEV